MRVLVVVLVGVLLAPGSARAQQKAGFDEAWNRGQDLFNLGKYDEARAEFDKARALSPKLPGPWRYLGKIAKIQQRWQDCVDAATEAIRLKPDSSNSDEVRADLDVCRSSLGRVAFTGTLPHGFGALAVTANVEGARVSVDGIGKGATPLAPSPIVAGKHAVSVEKDGYLPVQIDIDVVATIVVDVDAQLEVDPNAKTAVPHDEHGNTGEDITVGWIVVATNAPGAAILVDGKAPTPGPDGSFEATPGPHMLEVSSPGYETYKREVRVARAQKRTLAIELRSLDEIHRQNRMGYVFFGVAAAAGVTGAVFGFIENDKYEEARDAWELESERPPGATVPPGSPEAHVTTRAEYEDMKDEAASYGLVSNISYGVAVVALGVSVYYFVQARPSERDTTTRSVARRPTRLVPTVGAGEHGGVNAGLSLSGEIDW
jgi:tetratricopeptide (TPR) repeat protein